jgi:hypothetical protein
LIPDDRTLVCDEEEVLRRLIRREPPAAPEFTRLAEWKTVEHDLFAMVFDNHDGRLSQAVTKLNDVGEDDPVVGFLKTTKRWVFGLEDADDFRVRVSASCHDQSACTTLAGAISGLRDNTVWQLEKALETPEGDDIARLCRLSGQVMRGLRVAPEETSIRIEPSPGVKLADLLPLVLRYCP